MNTTTNYGLKLYEGTDLFNPLVVENPNAGDIDTALKAVSDNAVGTATELTTGTVHAITRADADRNVFLFVATSNFTAGDTFTLDGNQVSALTPDGQQLATGSYVIGSSVLCALHDTLITVYVNPAKAKDADMLDGHDSSYYATDSDLDTVAGTIQAVSDKVGTAVLTTTAPDCSGAINELNTHLNTHVIAQVTADGVKTMGQLFNELYQQYASSSNVTLDRLEYRITLQGVDYFYRVSSVSSDSIEAARVLGLVDGTIHIDMITFKATGSTRQVSDVNATGFSTRDRSSDIFSAGAVLRLAEV